MSGVNFRAPSGAAWAAMCLLALLPVAAQARGGQASTGVDQAGKVATSSVGSVGQRQTAAAGIKPTARLASRIESRISSRISTRLDRTYNAQVGAADRINAAQGQARTASQPR